MSWGDESKKKDKLLRKVPPSVREALSEQPPGIDSAELLTEILRAWGGPAALAADLRATFVASAPNSVVRQRIMDMIHRLVINNTAHGLTETRKPTDMTTDELMAQFQKYAERIAATDAPPATPAATPWDDDEEPDDDGD